LPDRSWSDDLRHGYCTRAYQFQVPSPEDAAPPGPMRMTQFLPAPWRDTAPGRRSDTLAYWPRPGQRGQRLVHDERTLGDGHVIFSATRCALRLVSMVSTTNSSPP
jgi:hypothetical protein